MASFIIKLKRRDIYLDEKKKKKKKKKKMGVLSLN